MMNTLKFFAALGLVFAQPCTAQNDDIFHCGTNEMRRLGHAAMHDTATMLRIAEVDAELTAFSNSFLSDTTRGGGASYAIPIVFHIIHNNGPENISDAQVLDALRILNEDFNRLNPDWDNVRSEFQGIVADVGVEFRLATIDPNGDCTNGITRTQSILTNEGAEQMKALISWPRNKYLQIWVAASAAGAAGYTFRPATAQFYPNEDGIVILHTYTGSTGTGSGSRSRALTHEVGHWINLKHTWGDGNDPGLPANCNMDDDVNDTPNTTGWIICNLNGTTCGSLDNVENYMDYSYCSKMFTEGQAVRMITSLNSGIAQRNQLWQTSNLNNTGVNGNAPLCEARFSSSAGLICAGGTVQYTDESFHNVTGRNWTFPGGDPATSTETNPVITYPSAGIYSASLTVTGDNATRTTSIADLVVVAPDPGQSPPLIEGFESATSFTNVGWTSLNPNGDNGFLITSSAAFSGTKSCRLTNSTGMAGKIDELISPSMDMTNAAAITVGFRHAFARRTASNDDRLRIYVSGNCGETWSLRRHLFAGSTLETSSIITSSFVPNGPDQWEIQQITNIGAAFFTSDFRVRFEFESDGGNNLYLDDINISADLSTGLNEMAEEGIGMLAVSPNPATTASQLTIRSSSTGKYRLDLLDAVGRKLVSLHDGDLAIGEHRMDLPVATLSQGVYFVRLSGSAQNDVIRFVVD